MRLNGLKGLNDRGFVRASIPCGVDLSRSCRRVIENEVVKRLVIVIGAKVLMPRTVHLLLLLLLKLLMQLKVLDMLILLKCERAPSLREDVLEHRLRALVDARIRLSRCDHGGCPGGC